MKMKLWQKMFLVLFTGLIIFPSAVDLAHVFSSHEHITCTHYAESHFHKKTDDCDICHFQQNTFSIPPSQSWSAVELEAEGLAVEKEYFFLSTFQKLHFSLRAPPVAV